MTIIFHEGLPGAGKSYEAMAERIVPALSKGREVVAYVEGIDHAKVAQVVGITEARCRELLFTLTREQVDAGFIEHARDNALIVLDEAQNFWGNRAKLGKEVTQFVTEHRHRGIDLVLMGQDLRDVHTLWRRRVDIKASFLQLNGLGSSKSYSVTTHRHLGQDRYEKVGTQVRRYDPKFFGTYASVVSDDISTETFKDKRAVVWNNPLLKFGIPAGLVVAVVGFYTVRGFFHQQPAPKAATVAVQSRNEPGQASARTTPPTPQATSVQPVASPPDTRTPQERRFADLSSRYRIRLAGLGTMGTRVQGIVEWVDGGTRVAERLTLDQLRDLGVSVVVTNGVVRLGVGEWLDLATMWPMESPGAVSAAVRDSLRPDQPPGPASPVVIIGEGRAPRTPFQEPAGDLKVSPSRGRS